jgi:hypothetical protein
MRFFVLQGPVGHKADFYFELDPTCPVGEAAKCGSCGNFYGMLPSLPPVKGRLIAEGPILGLSGNFGDEVIISESCLNAFDVHGVLGLERVRRIELSAIEGFHGIDAVDTLFLGHVATWGGELDRPKSGLKTSEEVVCSKCGYAGLIEGFNNVSLLEGSWRGHDLFTVRGQPGSILLTQTVVELCRTLHLAVDVVPAEDYSVWFLPRRTL